MSETPPLFTGSGFVPDPDTSPQGDAMDGGLPLISSDLLAVLLNSQMEWKMQD